MESGAMIDPKEARIIVRNALIAINLWSQPAENLVWGTGLQESLYKYDRQMGSGPALGYWQMEPKTHDDCYANFLVYHLDLWKLICELVSGTVVDTHHLFHPAPAGLS